VPLLFMFVFGVGSFLAGVAGVTIAPVLSVFPGLADQMGMDAFIVVVVGGFGSLAGAFLVAMIIGLLSSFGVQFLSQMAPVLAFAFMAIVLAIKPMGFFGERE
jgi:branched-chain amino acid transport system permease protein